MFLPRHIYFSGPIGLFVLKIFFSLNAYIFSVQRRHVKNDELISLFYFLLCHYFYFYCEKYLICVSARIDQTWLITFISLYLDSIVSHTNTHADTHTLLASGGLRRDDVLFTSGARRRPRRLRRQHPGCSTKMRMKNRLATADIKVIKIVSSFFLSDFRSRVTLKAFPRNSRPNSWWQREFAHRGITLYKFTSEFAGARMWCNIAIVKVSPRKSNRREIGGRRGFVARFAPRECSRKRRNKSSCHIPHTYIYVCIHIHTWHPFTSCAFRANPRFRIIFSNIAPWEQRERPWLLRSIRYRQMGYYQQRLRTILQKRVLK